MLYILKKITFTTLYCVLRHLNLHLEITGCSRYFDLSYISGQQLQLLILVQVLHAKFQSSHPGSVLHANSADEPCWCNHDQHSDLSNFVISDEFLPGDVTMGMGLTNLAHSIPDCFQYPVPFEENVAFRAGTSDVASRTLLSS